MDISSPDQVEKSLRPETSLEWLETPTFPLLKIADIADISQRVKQHSSAIEVALDNTFASPYLQQPLKLGADFVVHSTTKYLPVIRMLLAVQLSQLIKNIVNV